MPMTSRERVLTTLAHGEPDRVPIVIGASNATGMKMRPYRGLKALLGIEAPDRYIYDWPELGTALPDEATLRATPQRRPAGAATRSRRRRSSATGRGRRTRPSSTTGAAARWRSRTARGIPGVHPLAEAETIAEIDAYPWPDMDDPSRVAHVRAEAAPARGGGPLRDPRDAVAALPVRARDRHAGDGDVPRTDGARPRLRRGAPPADRRRSARRSWATSSTRSATTST